MSFLLKEHILTLSLQHGVAVTAVEAQEAGAMLSTSCPGALGTAAQQDIAVATLLDQHSAPSKGLALHSAECWHTTALLPPQGQLQPGLPSESSGSHSQNLHKAAATPPPCFVESLPGETGIAKPVTKCKNLVALILLGFLGLIGSKARKHSAAAWSCSTTVF